MRHPNLDFKYGILENAAYETLFENGQSEKLKKMNTFMTENNFNFKSMEIGFEKLLEGQVCKID